MIWLSNSVFKGCLCWWIAKQLIGRTMKFQSFWEDSFGFLQKLLIFHVFVNFKIFVVLGLFGRIAFVGRLELSGKCISFESFKIYILLFFYLLDIYNFSLEYLLLLFPILTAWFPLLHWICWTQCYSVQDLHTQIHTFPNCSHLLFNLGDRRGVVVVFATRYLHFGTF